MMKILTIIEVPDPGRVWCLTVRHADFQVLGMWTEPENRDSFIL